MPTYTVTGYQWSGFTTYATPISIVIDDDDAVLDWFGGDTGTAQTATFGGTTYNIDGAGLLPTDIQDNDGGGGTSSEELLFMSLPGYGWVFVPMPGSVFTPGDALLGWTTGTWSDTDGVDHTDIACFTSGTKIETAQGLIKVEALSAGDLVLTRDHGPQPIRSLTATHLSIAQLISDPDLRPIIIRRAALGADCPCRDTRVSPQHRVLYRGWKAQLHFGDEEVLVPAKALTQIGLASRDDSLRPVSYVHMMFDAHEIVTADGLQSESQLPAGMAMTSAQRREMMKLAPLSAKTRGSGELVRQGVKVRDVGVLK